jgi:hypothetical protein
MTQDIYYFEPGYIDATYFVYTADASANITTSITLTATATRIYHISDNMSSQAYMYGPTSNVNVQATIIPARSQPRTKAVIIGNINA